jgi:predicted amidohydrolase
MKINVLVTQFPVSLSISENMNAIRDILTKAQPGDLVLLPEGAVSGYGSDLSFLDDLDSVALHSALDELRDLAQQLAIHLWVGSLIPENGFWFNAALGFTPIGGAYQYRKINLANHERGLITPGADLPVFDLLLDDSPVTVGIQLCREIRYPEQWGWLARQGAQVILHLNNATGDERYLDVWRSHLISHAASNQRFVLSSNTAAVNQLCPTMAISPQGFVLNEIISAERGFIRFKIDLAEVSNWYLDQARPDIVAIDQPTQKERRRIARTMKMTKLRADLDEIEANPELFVEHNFTVRTEALNFILMVDNLFAIRSKDRELKALHERTVLLRQQIEEINAQLFTQRRMQIQKGSYTPVELKAHFLQFTDYDPAKPHQPHYGYENLDGLTAGIFLAAPIPSESVERAHGMVRYQPTPVSVILEMVDQVLPTKKDVFYDLGSGLGQVIGLVNVLAGVKCVGVEFQPAYAAYSQAMIGDLRLENVTVVNADVRAVDLSEGTIFFLFNPFGGAIFDCVLEQLRTIAPDHPITVCSYGAATGPLSEQDWLQIVNPETNNEFKLAIFQRK